MKTPNQTANEKSTTTSLYNLFDAEYLKMEAAGRQLDEKAAMAEVMDLLRQNEVFVKTAHAGWLPARIEKMA